MDTQILKRLTPGGRAQALVCIPFAGGYSNSFRPLSKYFLDSNWDVYAIEPPGHGGNRMPCMRDIREMVDLYADVILTQVSTPFVLFGHSLGGLITFLLTQQLESVGKPPTMMVISATNPPHFPIVKRSDLAEGEFADYVVSLGGIPAEVVQHKELMDFIVPILRADFEAYEQYVHGDSRPVECPVYVFAGERDKGCPPGKVAEWREEIPHAKFYTFSGEHMFLIDQVDEVARKMSLILREFER